MTRHIPNAITCCNLLCGCIGLVQVSEGNLISASYLIAIALVLDFLDGFFARLLKAYSAIGKDLDSLADAVTFGVLPSMMIFTYLEANSSTDSIVPYSAFLIAIFSILRLAKFNNDPRQSDGFIGVPTPANAILIASLPLIALDNVWLQSALANNTYLVVFTLVMSYLLVAELSLLAFKFKNFKWNGNESRFIVMGISAILFALFQLSAIPLIIIFYLVASIAVQVIQKK